MTTPAQHDTRVPPATSRLTALRGNCMGAAVLLIVQLGLGMGVNLYVTLPARKSFLSTVFGSAVLAVHAIVALALLGAAVGALVRSARARRAVAFTSVGLAAIVAAAAAGASFVGNQGNGASLAMALATAVAMFCYLAAIFSLRLVRLSVRPGSGMSAPGRCTPPAAGRLIERAAGVENGRVMMRCRGPVRRGSSGTRPSARCRWPAVAGAAAVLAVAVGCTSSATTAPPVTPTPAASAASSPAASSAAASSSAADWPTYDRTAERSGVSVSSPVPGVVRQSWATSVDGAVYAQPLVVGSEVIVATETDSVYALSASSGAVMWTRHLASPVTAGLPCGNINPSGITGTPVADPSTGRLWVVTFTAQPTYRHTLWELDLATGRTLWQRPIDVSGSDPRAQQERGALTLLGSRVYVPFGGLYGDCSDYKGRVVGAPVSGAGPVVSFTTPNQREAGIWAPAGESVRDGSLYLATGNGTPYDQVDDSDSVLRLSPGLTVQDRFTPADFVALSAGDLDLGSTAPALLPDGLIFQIGKQGIGYVLDGSRLGGTGGELASLHLCEGGFGGDAVDDSSVVFSCFTSLRAIEVTPTAQIHILWSVTGYAAGPPIIAGGVVWDVSRAGLLSGFRLSDGKSVFSTATGPVVTDFPSLSASGTRLIVPEGDKIVSYLGI